MALRDFLDEPFAGNPARSWIYALAAFAVSFVVLSILKRVVTARLAKLAERTETDIDDLFVDLLRKTKTFFLVATAFFIAHHWLTISDRYESYIRNGYRIAMWLQGGLWGLALVHFAIHRMVRRGPADDPSRAMGASVLTFIGSTIVWSLVFLLALQAMGQPIGPLIASLGIGGIAVALALQNVLGDLFASITILLDKPFVVGDWVVLGEFSGKVERIGIKSTRLRAGTGEEIAVGNNDLVSSRMRNFKHQPNGFQQFTLGVTYQTPAEKVEAIPRMLREVVEATPGTRFGRAHLARFGDFALIYEIVYAVLSGQKDEAMGAQQAILLEIHRRFEKEGIHFAYPTQTVYHAGPAAPPQPQKELSRG